MVPVTFEVSCGNLVREFSEFTMARDYFEELPGIPPAKLSMISGTMERPTIEVLARRREAPKGLLLQGLVYALLTDLLEEGAGPGLFMLPPMEVAVNLAMHVDLLGVGALAIIPHINAWREHAISVGAWREPQQ